MKSKSQLCQTDPLWHTILLRAPQPPRPSNSKVYKTFWRQDEEARTIPGHRSSHGGFLRQSNIKIAIGIARTYQHCSERILRTHAEFGLVRSHMAAGHSQARNSASSGHTRPRCTTRWFARLCIMMLCVTSHISIGIAERGHYQLCCHAHFALGPAWSPAPTMAGKGCSALCPRMRPRPLPRYH